ncbi:MAG: gluconate 2-dehydrogenase subunit 3 family protein [Novosphingobium sp.]
MTFIDRRSLLQRAFWLAGATAAPALSFEAWAQSATSAPQLLDAPHFELLTAVADTMVPRTDTAGAVEAGVPRAFDGLLRNWASPKRRDELVAALERIDKLALSQDKRGFAKLSPARRAALLTIHDAEALKPPSAPAAAPAAGNPPSSTFDPNYGRPKQTPPQAQESQTKPEGESFFGVTGPTATDPAYLKLKELIVTLYYVSEAGLTQELTYEHAPGKWQPSIPVTAATRPSGGLAPI